MHRGYLTSGGPVVGEMNKITNFHRPPTSVETLTSLHCPSEDKVPTTATVILQKWGDRPRSKHRPLALRKASWGWRGFGVACLCDNFTNLKRLPFRFAHFAK